MIEPTPVFIGTDGVEKKWSSQRRNLIYKGKVLQKQCQQMRNFGSHGAERRSLKQLQMELASNHAPEENRCTMRPVFEVKKEMSGKGPASDRPLILVQSVCSGGSHEN
jgi:hypothetical protein